uniref:Uncharacterized protein n=1 Tax=Romanomermis culicivorax TaxID=13658 RepID=A0A915JM82_ROMCU
MFFKSSCSLIGILKYFKPFSLLISRFQTPSKKGLSGPPPQPDPTRLPQQQIEAMLKKYNIFSIKKDATPSSDTGFSPPLTDEQTKSAYDDSSSPPSSSNDYNSLNDATIINNDDVFCCDSGSTFDLMGLNLPAVSTRGQSQSSNSSFYSTSTACSNVNAPNSVSIPVMTCGRPIVQHKYCDENEDDQMLSSLPKSYDEFVETKESSAVVAVAVQPRAFISQTSHSPSCSSQRTPSLNCGRIDSVVLTPSTSPSLVDPDDLEVQMINESFEDQVKQAQVLSDQKTKEAFYRQPNSTGMVSSSSACGLTPKRTLSTSSNQMTQQLAIVDDVIFAPSHSFSSVASTASLKSSNGSAPTKFESFAFPSPQKSDTKKLSSKTLKSNPNQYSVKLNWVFFQQSTITPNHQPPSFKEQTAPVSTEKGLTWASWGSGTSNVVPKPNIKSTHEEGSLFAAANCQSSSKQCSTADPPVHRLKNAAHVAHTAIVADEDTVNLELFGEEMIASLLSDENELEFK